MVNLKLVRRIHCYTDHRLRHAIKAYSSLSNHEAMFVLKFGEAETRLIHSLGITARDMVCLSFDTGAHLTC